MTTSAAPARPGPEAKRTTLDGGTLITMKEIRAKFRLGRTAGYELVRRPDFPARIVISPRCHRWLESEVDAFGEALRDHPVARWGSTGRRVQPPGLAAAPRRLTGEVHPVRARKERQ
jgi:predicted DNA-binding transcriptional regulator AlpA